VREGDVADLQGALESTPAVVVGAGPSLDSQLDALRALAGRAAIIAVDTALRPLLAAGITPHIVVAVDPSSINASHLVDVTGSESVFLVAEASVDPHAIAAFRERVFACRVASHDPWPMLEA